MPSGKRKIWHENSGASPTKAKDAYVGTPFRVNRNYAERFGDRWVILSAKYGFLDPDSIIPSNYNVSFKDPSTNPMSLQKLKKQIKKMGLDRFDTIIVLRDHRGLVTEAFSDVKATIRKPLAGLTLGRGMSKVKHLINTGKPYE